jgi:integrase
VHTWGKKLRAEGYAQATVVTIIKIMTMMLADAADERLIPINPIQPRRRGKRRHEIRTERVWATPEQVLGVAAQAAALVGDWAAVLMITAAWTGTRWGELAGLRRHNTHLDGATIVIDRHTGALHEVNRRLELGTPKTAESARTITLPPLLVDLLRTHLDGHDHPHVFITSEGELLRRSTFARRAMRPAADGNHHRTRPRTRVHPSCPDWSSTASATATKPGSSPTWLKPGGSDTASPTRSNTSTPTSPPKSKPGSSTPSNTAGPPHCTPSPTTPPLPEPSTTPNGSPSSPSPPRTPSA